MLHLLPIRVILWSFAAVAALTVLGFAWAGSSDADALSQLPRVLRWVGTIVSIGILVLFAGWRWIPWLQGAIFPYLGGQWSGSIHFEREGQTGSRPAMLEVRHRVIAIRLMLETAESTSRTLAVHAEKDPDFDRYRLFYVFLNERKEGVPCGGTRYRGLAILRIEPGAPLRLVGDYFTDTQGRGRLTFERIAPNPWWKLWR